MNELRGESPSASPFGGPTILAPAPVLQSPANPFGGGAGTMTFGSIPAAPPIPPRQAPAGYPMVPRPQAGSSPALATGSGAGLLPPPRPVVVNTNTSAIAAGGGGNFDPFADEFFK